MVLVRLATNVLPHVLGLVLLGAAALKAAETGEMPPTLALIGFEVALGAWLVSGVGPRGARVAAVACFAAFFGAATAQVAVGEGSCGCLGALRVPPWGTAAFDFAAVALLWCGGDARPLGRSRRLRLPLLILFAAGAGAGLTWYGTARTTDEPTDAAIRLELGRQAPGSRVEREVWVENRSGAPVSVASVRTSCPCLSVALSEPTIGPGQKVAARVVLDLGKEPGFRGELRPQAQGRTSDGKLVFQVQARVSVEP